MTGVACDDDFFSDRRRRRRVDRRPAAFTNADGNLDLRLYTAAGTLLDASEGGTDTERVTAGPLKAGTYVLRVYPRQGVANANDYSLAVVADDVTAPHGCPVRRAPGRRRSLATRRSSSPSAKPSTPRRSPARR